MPENAVSHGVHRGRRPCRSPHETLSVRTGVLLPNVKRGDDPRLLRLAVVTEHDLVPGRDRRAAAALGGLFPAAAGRGLLGGLVGWGGGSPRRGGRGAPGQGRGGGGGGGGAGGGGGWGSGWPPGVSGRRWAEARRPAATAAGGCHRRARRACGAGRRATRRCAGGRRSGTRAGPASCRPRASA